MAEIKTSRIDGGIDRGPDLVTKFGQLESDLRSIFGIPADTAMSEAMDVGTGTNATMTGALSLAGVPTSDLMACNKDYLQTLGGAFGSVRCRTYLSDDRTQGNIPAYVNWWGADVNTGGMWSNVYPSRMTIPADQGGHYMVGVTTSLKSDYPGNNYGTSVYLQIKVNRAFSFDGGRQTLIRMKSDTDNEIGKCGVAFYRSLSAGDYLELKMSAWPDVTQYSANTTMWAFKVS